MNTYIFVVTATQFTTQDSMNLPHLTNTYIISCQILTIPSLATATEFTTRVWVAGEQGWDPLSEGEFREEREAMSKATLMSAFDLEGDVKATTEFKRTICTGDFSHGILLRVRLLTGRRRKEKKNNSSQFWHGMWYNPISYRRLKCQLCLMLCWFHSFCPGILVVSIWDLPYSSLLPHFSFSQKLVNTKNKF